MRGDSTYSLVETTPGGFLLDPIAGTIFSLNDSAAQIWRSRLEGAEPSVIARSVAERYGLPLEVAVRDVESALRLPTTGTPPRPPSDFLYERRDDHTYVFSFQGAVVFEVDDRGTHVRLACKAVPRPLPYLLQAVIPKILSLRGHLVIHASAVALGENAVAFTGLSGAGKTTTARSLASHGGRALCEDKLFLRVSPGAGVDTPIGAEAVMKAWIADNVPSLARHSDASCAPLDEAARGPSLPLRELGALDVARRRGARVAASRLAQHDAATAVFRQMFWGSDAITDWRRLLNESVTLASHVSVYELELPNGLHELDRAVSEIVARRTLATP